MNTSLQDPLIGQLIDDRYRVGTRIAVGGMATVYRAVDTRLDRVLALKVMHPSLAADAAFVERFIQEAKSAARLDHPNIVQVTDQGTDGGYVYLAMEHVAGCTLRDLLRDGPLQPRVVLDVLEPVLAGLAAAHRAGLVHRDVKPENVLIGDDGRVKVTDFGLVRGVGGQTSAGTGSLLGTVSYLAPEQIEHGPLGPWTDVYACGVMLYELLTGAKPHTGDSPAQVLLAHVGQDVPPPSLSVSGIPPELDGLVARAAARDPRARPGDAAALLSLVQAVRAALSDGQLDARPARGTGAAPGPEDVTRAVPSPVRAGEPGRVERTALIETPPDGPSGPPTSRRAGRRGPPRRAVVVLVAAALAVLGVGAGVWYVNAGQFVRTPAVLTVPRAEAEQTLAEAGLGSEVVLAFSATVDRGLVIGTDPAPGERVRKNATVTLTVSRGPERVTVPDVGGVPLEEARRRLTDAGLSPGRVVRAFDAAVEQGAVVSTDPAAGAALRPEGAVGLTVSRGPELKVPEVLGLPEGAAAELLAEAGFTVEVVAERVHSEHPAGSVAAQDPEPSATAGRGDTVTLTLSKGPELAVVPDVRGEPEERAVATLEAAGFEVEVVRLFFTGTVFNQSVHSGDSAPKGSTITIFVR